MIVAKKKRPRRITGRDCKRESCPKTEKIVERATKIINKRTGIFNGFERIVTFLSTIALTAQRIKSIRALITTIICFGKVKKSVVMVKKNTGNKRYTTAIKMVAADDIYVRAVLFCMFHFMR